MEFNKEALEALAKSGMSSAEFLANFTEKISMITKNDNFLSELRMIGFTDYSADKNGLAFRKALPGGLMELAYYIQDKHIRYQTISSGVTIQLLGIDSIEKLDAFCKIVTAKSILEI